MIEYAKVVLPGMVFNRHIFKKELKKCIAWMTPAELGEFREWCFRMFYPRYPEVLEELFPRAKAI